MKQRKLALPLLIPKIRTKSIDLSNIKDEIFKLWLTS